MNTTKKLYIETFGCQMNVADSKIAAAILKMAGYNTTTNPNDADAILLNTCSVREHAEKKAIDKLTQFQNLKKKNKNLIIGVLGCMAERLKSELLNKNIADLVAGPDAYLDLPHLLASAAKGEKAINVTLSTIETYNNIIPDKNCGKSITSFVPIMRGCNNFCTYCIVPYTRGRERSRDINSIMQEIIALETQGGREITLLGQNVNSYNFDNGKEKITFPKLLQAVADNAPNLRVRFTTSHPKDINMETINVVGKNQNVCKQIHLPVQSGSNNILKAMNRNYTREWYLENIKNIKKTFPQIALSTDILCGFPSESDDDHRQTLALMKEVKFDSAFMFKYSQRPGTFAAKNLPDNVPENVKIKRLNEIITLQLKISLESNINDVGKITEVLVEGVSKRSNSQLYGRNSQNKVVIFDKNNFHIGDTVNVKITHATAATLLGMPA
jgi:tRNA-2-methylthio-N6-dimethylallyladenosine synthase